jgi:hypothetical protein
MHAKRRAVTVILAAFALLAANLAIPSMATAAPKPVPGGVLLGRDIVTKQGARQANPAVVYECDIYGNPDPQYSASNSTVHWGIRSSCNFTPSEQSVSGTLYTVVGGTENWQDAGSASSLTDYVDFSRTQTCTVRFSEDWTVYWTHSMLVDGDFYTTSGQSNPTIFNIGCADLA